MWAVAIWGPEITSSAIRSLPIPSRWKRPSVPLVAVVSKRKAGGPEPWAAAPPDLHNLQPGRQVAGRRLIHRRRFNQGPGNRPPFEVEDAALDGDAVLHQADCQIGGAGSA